MILKKISVLIILITEIKFSALQEEDFLNVPWIDTVSNPTITPSDISLNTSLAVPVNNSYDRLASIAPENHIMVNTGNNLIIYALKNTSTYTIGGVLGLIEYKMVLLYFHWNLNLGRSAVLVDNVGSALHLDIAFVNINYTLEDAYNHRDGWFLLRKPIQVVQGASPNDLYPPFEDAVRQVSKEGTSTILTTDGLKWLDGKIPVHHNEYCYPGSYYNMKTGETTYSATSCISQDPNLPVLNPAQFFNSFGKLRNKANKPFSNIAPLQPVSPCTPFALFPTEITGRPPN